MMPTVRAHVLFCLMVLTGAIPVRSEGGGDGFVFPVPGGWAMQVDTAVYGPDNLWEYINGAADLFVTYGFEELHCATYRTASGDEVRAEVYRHASAVDAYGMYSQERSPENAAVELGSEGCADAGMVNIVFGRWYLKMSALPAVGREEMMHLARAFDRTLGSPRGLPPEFSSLPSAGRAPRSEQYIARDFLGYGFLNRAFLARYGDGDGARIFLLRTASAEAAETVRESLVRVAGGKGTPAGPSTTHLVNPHHGAMDLVVRGADVFGVLGYGKNESLRLELLKKLQ